MPDTTTHLALPYILAAQAQKHVTHNEALRLLDGLIQISVLHPATAQHRPHHQPRAHAISWPTAQAVPGQAGEEMWRSGLMAHG